MKLSLYLYILLIVILHLIPLGDYALNKIEFGPFRADYLLHTGLFLPWMLFFHFRPAGPRRLKKTGIGPWKTAAWTAAGIALAVGVEGVQYWLPHRSFNPMDALFNALGVVAGGVAAIPGSLKSPLKPFR